MELIKADVRVKITVPSKIKHKGKTYKLVEHLQFLRETEEAVLKANRKLGFDYVIARGVNTDANTEWPYITPPPVFFLYYRPKRKQ